MHRSPPGWFYFLPGHLPPRRDRVLVALHGGPGGHLHAVAHAVQQPGDAGKRYRRGGTCGRSACALAQQSTPDPHPIRARPDPHRASTRAWHASAGRDGSRSRKGPWNAAPPSRWHSRCGATGRPTFHSPVTSGRSARLSYPARRDRPLAPVSLPDACAARRSARPRLDTAYPGVPAKRSFSPGVSSRDTHLIR
jgi:hypothetical protein